jgi:beta-lactam-binding protein with PASTA domain
MVVGKPPFAGDNPVAIAYKHVREDALPPTQANRAVPSSLEAIVLKAMAKDKANRYQSADEMRADLLRYLRGNTVLADVPPTAVVASTRAQPTYRETTTVAPVPPPEDDRRGAYIAAAVLGVLLLLGLLFLLGRQLGIFGGSKSKPVTVPADLVGKPVADAQTELSKQGLKSQVQQQANDTQQQGNVFDTNPKPGTQAKTGDTVTLLVSAGPTPVQVPNVTNMDATQAANILTQAGLHPVSTPQASNTVANNVVISQSPAAGTQAPKGSTVNLVVSSGKTQVQIPNEQGKDPAAAANDLGNLQLKATTANEPSDTVPSGKVTRTDPAAGAMVAQGSSVVIYVSSGPAPVAVPNVVGQTQGQAQATLTAAGFQVTANPQPTPDQTKDGKVLSESPAAGTKAPKGSTVTIAVGQFQATTLPPTTPPTT